MKTQQSIIIQASSDYLFDLTQDYDKRKDWDSLMSEIELLILLPIQKGSQLRYTANNGVSIVVEYQNYQRLTIASIGMISDSKLFTQFGGGWRFRAVDRNVTEVTFAYSFQTKFLPKVFNPIFAKIFAYENQKRFDALKHYAQANYQPN